LIFLKSEGIYSIRTDVLQQHEEGTCFNFGIQKHFFGVVQILPTIT